VWSDWSLNGIVMGENDGKVNGSVWVTKRLLFTVIIITSLMCDAVTVAGGMSPRHPG